MSININSEASCRKAYLNYHCYGNTMKISAEEMGEIAKRWENKLESWQKTVSSDENHYEFDDSEFLTSKEKGKKQTQKNTEFDGKADNAGSKIATSANWIGGLLGCAMGVVAVITKICSKLKGKISNPFTSAVIGAILVANAIYLKVAKPNKEAAKACDQMTNTELPNAQAALEDSQADMEDMSNKIIKLSDQAHDANEEANDDIKERKTEFDFYKTSYEALKTKAQSGEGLNEDEKSLYVELRSEMVSAQDDIGNTQTEATDVVGEVCEEMETYQAGYDYAAETIAEVEGVTEFAESFDKDTKHNAALVKSSCIMGAIGAAGVVASGIQGAATSGLNVAQYIASGVAIATGGTAGALFSIVAKEQGEYKSKAETEIIIREDTQDFNAETNDIYAEEIDAYDGIMQNVKLDLEIDMPKDIEAPKDTALPLTTNNKFPDGTPDPIKPKKEEEEK